MTASEQLGNLLDFFINLLFSLTATSIICVIMFAALYLFLEDFEKTEIFKFLINPLIFIGVLMFFSIWVILFRFIS